MGPGTSPLGTSAASPPCHNNRTNCPPPPACYSLGVLLNEMLSGERPWQGLQMAQVVHTVRTRGREGGTADVPRTRTHTSPHTSTPCTHSTLAA